jgi:hypothetical protein
MDSQQYTQDDTNASMPPVDLPPLSPDAIPGASVGPQGIQGLPPLPVSPQPQTQGLPPADPPMQAGQTVPDHRALVPAPEFAADEDLIEKEWVEKAKNIVEHTAEDPFKQVEELSKMKADYLKKRYNKEIN